MQLKRETMFSLRSLSASGVVLFVLFASQFANAQQFVSGERQVPLIELYTSEGCSSCPRADRWMSKLTAHDDLWSGFVPIALHVDYWDYIGWKDPFASRDYSQRQRQIAAENKERTVYTPGVRKAGDEWRSWRLWGSPTLDNSPLIGDLILDVNDLGLFRASFKHSETKSRLSEGGLQLNVAVLGLGLSTDVKRGENRGKTLEHDFVVLSLSRISSAEKLSWSGTIDKPAIEAQRYALAAWVSEKGRTKPIQSTGGYLSKQLWSEPSKS